MTEYKALRVYQDNGKVINKVVKLTEEELGKGDVLIRSSFSSINYKDALGATGAGRILKSFPLIAGIDVSGEVLASSDKRYKKGDPVLVTGCGLGESHNGGYSQIVRVPGDWIVPLPKGLSLREAMIFGTAGFTAGLCIARLSLNGLSPEKGPVVVTGASGGVGSLAVAMLAKNDYEVIAVSGKKDQVSRLKEIGASQVCTIDELELGTRPLEKARFAAAIDNVGGSVLEGLIPHVNLWGSIACVGLALDHKFSTTVMPLILRGVSLLGISSTNCPYPLRSEVWQMLASKLKPNDLESFVSRELELEDLDAAFHDMLGRKTVGRSLVKL